MKIIIILFDLLNNFIFLERELITPPLNGLILPGITRDSILHLAKEWRQFKVTERPINMFEVKKALYENRVSSITAEKVEFDFHMKSFLYLDP